MPIIWTDKCYINLRSVHILRSVPHLKLPNQATSQYNTAHALAIPFLVALGFFFLSNRHNQPAMGFKLILNAHRTYFTPQAMRYAFTRYVCTCVCVQIRQYWSEHLCAPTSSTSYVLIFINVFRFWRFFCLLLYVFLCLAFSISPVFFSLSPHCTQFSYTLCQVKPTMNVQLCCFFFSFFFIFIRLLLDLRSRNRTIVISSVARYISHCYCNTTVVIVKSTKIHSWARDRPTDTWSSSSNRHSHSSTPR